MKLPAQISDPFALQVSTKDVHLIESFAFNGDEKIKKDKSNFIEHDLNPF